MPLCEMSLKKTRYTYRAAAEGTAPDPPQPLLDAVSHVEGVDDLIAGAVERITRVSVGKPIDFTAFEFVQSRLDGDERLVHDVLRIAMYLARADTRYWGIEDPEVESYCSHCRQALPVECFESREANNCMECEGGGYGSQVHVE